MEQRFVIENLKSFEPKHIFECGQCFRWNLEENQSYTVVFGENVLNVKKEDKKIVIKGICKAEISDVCKQYFDLDTNYEEIKEKLAKVDNNLKISTEYGSGIRILKQDLWEVLISFIISTNNNIPRIKGIIERISTKYGKKIVWNNKEYYTFPSPKELSKASVEDLRNLGLGFRDKRVFETTKMVIENKINLEDLKNEKNICVLKEKLLQIPGIGPKVADCIMLFALRKFEVFPIDVWVKRVMNDLYFKSENEAKVNHKEIDKLAKDKFGDLAGLAQQYLFYWRRDK